MIKHHVFYAPHSDDETIGMAGSIVDAKESGARVVLVLVTDNLPSAKMRDAFAWYEGDLAAARVVEFDEAANRLGVDQIMTLGFAESVIASDRRFAVAYLASAFRAIATSCSIGYSNDLVLHTTCGDSDTHTETLNSNRAHSVCEDALRRCKSELPHIGAVLHKIYVYSRPVAERTAPTIRELSPLEMWRKVAALNAYKKGGDRIGYGYRSVPELFDGAASDPREYMEVL